MPFSDTDFVNGYLFEIFQLLTGKTLLEVTFLNVFDGIPADTQVMCCILDGHVSGQLKSIAALAQDKTEKKRS